MARRRKKRTLKPRVPSRVKRRKRGAKKAEGHQHPELIGLVLLALGVFLGFVVWADWNGGYVGLWIEQGLDALIGSATLGLPAAPAPLAPPVDVVNEFPELVSEGPPAFPQEEEPDQESLFDVTVEPQAEYRLPDRALLRRSAPGAGPDADHAARVAEALVQTLANFGVDATVIGQIAGPRVTRYELQLAPGTKVSKVAGLKDDLSYALATTEIRILAPIPGKQAVGVELPNLSPNLVTLGDIFGDLPQAASPLAVWLGKDISGSAVWADLARMPHLLIAGTTGSGKSGCINTILTSILLRATPDEVRMILIDPKRIELNHYESIPHLLTPVVSSPKEASAVLANCVAEMERRYERLSSVRARNLNEANRAFRQRGEPTMPYLLVVIDELADLMMIAPATACTASSTPTTTRCSTRRSRSSCRRRPRRCRSCSAASGSATRGRAGSSTCSSGEASSAAMKARSRAASSSTRARSTSTPPTIKTVKTAARWVDRKGIATLFPGADLVLPSLWEAVSGRLDVDWAIRDEEGR